MTKIQRLILRLSLFKFLTVFNGGKGEIRSRSLPSIIVELFRIKVVKKRFQSLPIVEWTGGGRQGTEGSSCCVVSRVQKKRKKKGRIYNVQVPVYSYKISVQIVKSVHSKMGDVARDRSFRARGRPRTRAARIVCNRPRELQIFIFRGSRNLFEVFFSHSRKLGDNEKIIFS